MLISAYCVSIELALHHVNILKCTYVALGWHIIHFGWHTECATSADWQDAAGIISIKAVI